MLIIPPSVIRILELQRLETEFISLLFTADFLLEAGLHVKFFPRFSLGEKPVHSKLSLSSNQFAVIISQLNLIRLLLERSDIGDRIIAKMKVFVKVYVKVYVKGMVA